MPAGPSWRGAAIAALALAATGCGTAGHPAAGTTPEPPLPAALVAQARPIGRGARFHPPVTGPVLGACRPALGPRTGVHLEIFGANRVVLIAAGIGTRPPRHFLYGRLVSARCDGALVTLDPTGLVLLRPGAHLTVADLMRSWGQPLGADGVAGFRGRVRAYVDGRPWPGAAGAIPLRRHAEIVLETGPVVPPHRAYTFPAGT